MLTTSPPSTSSRVGTERTWCAMARSVVSRFKKQKFTLFANCFETSAKIGLKILHGPQTAVVQHTTDTPVASWSVFDRFVVDIEISISLSNVRKTDFLRISRSHDTLY